MLNKHGGMENGDDDFSSIMFAQAKMQALIFFVCKICTKEHMQWKEGSHAILDQR